MLNDLTNSTIKFTEETEKLNELVKVINLQTEMGKYEIEKENEIFSMLDENIFKNMFEVSFFFF